MARQIVESGTTAWKPERYKDTYQAELKAAIEAKRKGKAVHRAAEIDEEQEPVDLMEALRASVQQAKRGKPPRAAGRGAARGPRSRATSSSRRSRGSGRTAR
jgi:DNA end-binding protein Ku